MNPKETPSEPERNPDKNHMKVYIAKYLRGVAYVLRVDFIGVICFSFLSFCCFFFFLLNCELQISVGISVGTARPQPCELQITVGTAGHQLRAPDLSGHCRTPTASSSSVAGGTPGGSGVDLGPVPHDMFSKNAWKLPKHTIDTDMTDIMPEGMPENMPERVAKKCQTETIKEF